MIKNQLKSKKNWKNCLSLKNQLNKKKTVKK